MDSILRKVIVGGGVTLLAVGIAKAMVFVSYVIAARILDPDEYGALSIVIYLQNFAVVIGCFGVPITITKKISQWMAKDVSMAQVVGSALLFLLLFSSAITSVGYLLLSETIAVDLYADPQLVRVLQLSSLFVVIACLNTTLSAFVQGCQKITALAKISAVTAILWQPIAVVTILTFGLEGAVLAMIIYNAMGASMLFYVARKSLPISFAKAGEFLGDRAKRKDLLLFTIPAFLMTVMISPAYWVGRTWLGLSWDFAEVGNFQIADSISQILLIVPFAISVPLLPAVSERYALDPKSIGGTSGTLLRLIAFVLVLLTIVAIPLMRTGIVWVFGEDYEGAYAATILMFAAATYISAGSVMSNVIFGMGRMWDALALNLVWLAVFLALMSYTVPDYGSEGLAATYAVSYSLYVSLIFVYIRMKLGVSIARVTIFAAAFMAYVFVYDLYLLEEDFFIKALTTAVVGLVFAIIGYFFMLTADDRAQAKGLLGIGR